MKINKIREMSSADLEKELGELKTELFKLKFSLATNGLENPMKIKEVKKDIARVNTILTERKIAEKTAEIEIADICSKVDKTNKSSLRNAIMSLRKHTLSVVWNLLRDVCCKI